MWNIARLSDRVATLLLLWSCAEDEDATGPGSSSTDPTGTWIGACSYVGTDAPYSDFAIRLELVEEAGNLSGAMTWLSGDTRTWAYDGPFVVTGTADRGRLAFELVAEDYESFSATGQVAGDSLALHIAVEDEDDAYAACELERQ